MFSTQWRDWMKKKALTRVSRRVPRRLQLEPLEDRTLLSSVPVLNLSTFLGGSGGEYAQGIAVDSAGNIYVAGDTSSSDFPTTASSLQSTKPNPTGGNTGFVAKFNPTLSSLIYCTYLGGTDGLTDVAGIAVDAAGDAYIVGDTGSTNFPTVNPVQATNPGRIAGFVAKLSPDGSHLIYSTYLGGSSSGDGDAVAAVALDSAGDAYVLGRSHSSNFPVTPGAFQTNFAGDGFYGGDVIVAKLNPTGSALIYSTYLGGSGDDVPGSKIAIDSAGNAYVGGWTNSTDFPTVNPFQPANAGGYDGFVAKLSADGSHLIYSSYLGGSGHEQCGLAGIDASGNAYMAGYTDSTNFPTVNAFQSTYAGGGDMFIAKINASGSGLVYSTYLGGSGFDNGDVDVDSAGNAYFIGTTTSTNFPTANPFQPTFAGGQDAFVGKLNPSGGLDYSSYLGGSAQDQGLAITVDGTGNAYVTGLTASNDFPITPGVFQTTNHGGGDDVFVTKIGTVSQLKVTGVPKSTIAGTAFNITVAAMDPYGNVATGYAGTVHFTSTDKKAALPADYTFTATDLGIHTFKVALVTAGPQTITATDTVTTTFTSKSSIKVTPAAVNHLKVTAAASTTAGSALNVTVTAQDAFNNTVTGYTGTVHFTSTDAQAALPADFTFTTTNKGVHTFSSGVTLNTAGLQTVMATDSASVTGSASVAAKPGKASTLSISAPSSVSVGVAFTFTVTALDAYGNVASGYTGTLHFSSSDGAASLPENFTFLSSDAGVETFTAILNTTGSQSLMATDSVTPGITGIDPAIQVS